MTHWTTPAGMKYLGPHQDSTPLEITLVLRRRQGGAPAPTSWPRAPRWQRGDFGRHCGAEPADLASLRRFALTHGLTEVGADEHRRVLHLRGAPQVLERAFGVILGRYQLSDGRGPFIGSGQAPTLPPEVIAVLGLDRRPVASVRSRRPRAAPTVTYTPLELGRLYNLPRRQTAAGRRSPSSGSAEASRRATSPSISAVSGSPSPRRSPRSPSPEERISPVALPMVR